jgi:hypothetical protein
LFPAKIALCWSHWRYQSGTGAYKVDGPRKPEHERGEEGHGEGEGGSGHGAGQGE